MIRGTTPTHVFTTDVDLSDNAEHRLRKKMSDCKSRNQIYRKVVPSFLIKYLYVQAKGRAVSPAYLSFLKTAKIGKKYDII